MLQTKLPLFPLPSHILPGGRLPLRIIEERYIRMIKECSKTMSGFGIVMLDSQSRSPLGRISAIGTHVQIVDFYSLDDGFLGIVVEGIERFIVSAVETESDGLKVADIKFISNWPDQLISTADRHLSNKLSEIYTQHPELNQLYVNKYLDDASWVSQRWLEILPISVEQKQALLKQANCATTLQVLNELMPNELMPNES